MSNHEQSIGGNTEQPVDGIKGSNPGTQQPSGAHVDAGGGPAVNNPPDDQQQPGAIPGAGHTGGMPSGQDGRGVAQPSGITGVIGSSDQSPLWAGKYNGSLSLAGRKVGIKVGCGSRGASAI